MNNAKVLARTVHAGTAALLARTGSPVQPAPLARAGVSVGPTFTRHLAMSARQSALAAQGVTGMSYRTAGVAAASLPVFGYSMRALSTTPEHSSPKSDEADEGATRKPYKWIDEEARELIAKAYKRHKALADKSQSFPPSLSVADLEKIGEPYHYEPQDFVDRFALNLMNILRVFVHAFFREKYDHHAVCLETVAAVPGIVASFHRHLRSLRRMKRDHGWINVLQEEAENERMHLLIFMQVCQPTVLERSLVIFSQALYLAFYSTLYLFNSRAAHRLTGYLEEEAHRAYTDYLASLDSGKLSNKPAPAIARDYYRLPENAKMREVVLHVRADEAMHRDVNHHFGNKCKKGDLDSPPSFIKD